MVGRIISHYRILEKLGEGGMGVVYKAHDNSLDRDVALKFLPPELTRDSHARERFIREAKAASALDHINITVVHEVGETDDGRSFICMGYYSGETLKNKVDRGPLGVQETIDIALQIADGLLVAHGAGIVHRDMKPANVLITEGGVVKIVDFGLAKLAGDVYGSTTSRRAGTAAYMSPEQIQDRTVDQRSDLFSLGIILYEMVTGKRPFYGELEPALFYSIVNSDPIAPSKYQTDLPAGLEQIILRLLEKDPDGRYQNALELKDDLNKVKYGLGLSSFVSVRASLYKIRTKLLLAMGVVLVGAIVYFALFNKAKEIFPLERSEYILVANVDNNTNDKNFDHALTLAIKVSLRQSPVLNIFPTERLYQALRRMKKSEDQPINDSTSIAIARREGVRIIIAGGIDQIGTRYILSAKIIDAVKGEPIWFVRKEVSLIENVLSEMDKMCEEIRKALGESIQEISRYAMPLEKVTTPSLEALELYSRGDIFQNNGDFRSASVLKEQALSKDSLFTFAISDLSYLHRKLGNDSLALFYHKKVLPLLSRVSDRERLYILSMYYGPSGEFDLPKAIHNIQEFAVIYPNDALGYAQLGWLAMYSGDTKTAIEAGQHSIAIDSVYAGTVYNNMGYALAQSGNANEALYYFANSKKLRPSYTAIDAYIVQSRWMREEYDSVERSLKSLLNIGDPKRKALTYFQLISLLYFSGRLKEAEYCCLDAIAFCDAEKLVDDIAYIHYLYGEVAADRNNYPLYRSQMNLAEQFSRSPFLEVPLVGASYARHGYVKDAEKVQQKLTALRSSDPYFLKRKQHFNRLIKGEIQLTGKNFRKAINELSAVKKIQGADPYFLLAQWSIARCYIQLDDSTGIKMFGNFLERRGEAVNAFVLAVRNAGIWTRKLWPEADFELGKIYMRQNNKSKAEFHLRKCLECWTSGDNEFKMANEARLLLHQITNGR